MSVKHGCLCLDEHIAIPKAFRDAVLEDIDSTHPESSAMLSVAQKGGNSLCYGGHSTIIPRVEVFCVNCDKCGGCVECGVKTIQSISPHFLQNFNASTFCRKKFKNGGEKNLYCECGECKKI